MTEGTLVYIFRGNEVLLAMKKRDFGKGKWNGPGGKMKAGEMPTEAGVRETQEEIGVTPVLGDELGRIQYHDEMAGDWVVHVFRTEAWAGEPTESEEMRPRWFGTDVLPYQTMWSGDDQWMPHVVNNQKFSAEMWFDGKQNNVKSEIKIL